MPSYPWPRNCWPLFVLACLSAVGFCVPIWDSDTWWHLATGRYIIETGQIPQTDPFSYTASGQAWHGPPWLSDVILYLGFRLAGTAGVVALQVVAAAAALLGVGLIARRLRCALPSTLALMVLIALVIQPQYARARPETLAAPLLVVELFCVLRASRLTPASPSILGVFRVLPWPTIFLLWAWSQMHSSVVLGIAVLLGTVVADQVRQFDARRLGAWAALVAMASLPLVVTDVGRGVVSQLVTHFQIARSGDLHFFAEFQRPRWWWTTLWFPFAIVSSGMVPLLRHPRQNFLLLGLAAVGCYAMTRAQRMLGVGFLLGAPALAAALSFLESTNPASHIQALLKALRHPFGMTGDWLQKAFSSWRRRAPLVLAGVVLVVSGAYVTLSPTYFRTTLGFGMLAGVMPEQNVALLRRLPEGRVMHDLRFGGFLIWQRIPTYVDGRGYQVFSPRTMRSLLIELRHDPTALEENAARYQVAYGLSNPFTHMGAAMMRNEDWRPVRYDRVSVLFVRERNLDSVQKSGVDPVSAIRLFGSRSRMKEWYDPIVAMPERRRRLVEQLQLQRAYEAEGLFSRVLEFLRAEYPELLVQAPSTK